MTDLFKPEFPYLPTGDQPQAIEKIVEGFALGKKHQTLLGVTGSGKTFTMACVIEKMQKRALVLAPNKTLAAQLFGEFKSFFPHNAVEYFVSYYDYYRPEAYVPGTDTFIEKDAAINDEIDKLRHSATRNLLEREDVIVVASVSCIYGIGSPEEYAEQKLILFKGENKPKDELTKQLVFMQYHRNDVDLVRGTFRSRGDVLEIFPAHEDAKVLRVEFFDDEIDQLSLVDPLRGTVISKLTKFVLYPSSHYVVGQNRMKEAIAQIRIELRQRLKELESQNKLLEYQRLNSRTQLDLEMLEEMGFCSGIENYSRHFSDLQPGEAPYTLLDFFKKDFLLFIDESHLSIPQIGGMYKGDRARKMTLVEHGFRLPCALDNRPLNFTEFEQRMDKVLFISATPADYELEKSLGEITEQIIRPTGLVDPEIEVRSAKNQVDDLLIEIKKSLERGHKVLVTTLTKKLSEELTTYYKSVGIKVRYLHSDIDTLERLEILNDLRSGVFDVLVGINLLREGLDLPEVALVAILDADKEGFLRSARSLIQTIGRAARNSQGKVIMYAYQQTPSMEKAISETNRRRQLQQQYNKLHNITPKDIKKEVGGGVLEVLRGQKKSQDFKHVKVGLKDLNEASIDSLISELRVKMKQFAKNLDFEEAAKVRDEIKKLSDLRFLS